MERLYPSNRGAIRAAAFAAAAIVAAVLPACVNPNAIGVQDTGSIVGRVIDAKTQKPIANATVNVNSLVGVTTDGSGAFSLTNNVPIGVQQLTVHAVGYATYTTGDIVVRKGETSQAGLLPLQPLNGP
jgi:hypothetical protein